MALRNIVVKVEEGGPGDGVLIASTSTSPLRHGNPRSIQTLTPMAAAEPKRDPTRAAQTSTTASRGIMIRDLPGPTNRHGTANHIHQPIASAARRTYIVTSGGSSKPPSASLGKATRKVFPRSATAPPMRQPQYQPQYHFNLEHSWNPVPFSSPPLAEEEIFEIIQAASPMAHNGDDNTDDDLQSLFLSRG